MIIGIPKEIKNNENRVSMTPEGVHRLTGEGHKVLIEMNAGAGSGIGDDSYKQAGAEMVHSHREVFEKADLIVKVKEPIEAEYGLLKEGQVLFTYLHLAPNPDLTDVLLKKKIMGIAYETVQAEDGSLPLLAPMSEVAGRMSVQIGANLLQKFNGGAGILLGGVPGVPPGEVLIIGGGVVGTNAAKMALGLGARVTVADINRKRLAYLDDIFGGRVSTIVSSEYRIAELLKAADLLIGAVLVTGAKAPRTVSTDMVKAMKKGSVIVDVAIDQGGTIETIDRITTHDDPFYISHGVVHYSVANIPGAVPRTSTFALTGVTLPFVSDIAGKGFKNAVLESSSLFSGVNTFNGQIAHEALAVSTGREYVSLGKML